MTINEIKNQPVETWVDFSGQIKTIGQTKERKKSQMSKQPGQAYKTVKLLIADETDEISVHAYLQSFQQGHLINGRGQLRDYQGHKYIDYATVQQVSSPVPPPQAKHSNNDAQEVICRQNAVKSTAIAISHRTDIPFDKLADSILEIAEIIAQYTITGKRPRPNEDGELNSDNADETPPQDDIPF